MKRMLFLLAILCSLFVVLPLVAIAGNQTWQVRPGDNLDIIGITLEIPKEEIKKHNPGVLESNLQVGQKLKLPLRPYLETNILETELSQKDARIENLERKNNDLKKQIVGAESQLRWYPVWAWGFWICFSIIAFIVCGAFWIFRQTHPRVFDKPRERSVRDLRESQIRVRSSFPREEPLAAHR